MAQLVNSANAQRHHALLTSMFQDRKTVFADQLGWTLSIRNGLEQDRFDAPGAEYLILRKPGSEDHLGSLRLLPTTRPHMLDTMFRDLCEGDIPRGSHVREISRLFLSPRFPRALANGYRAHLATALVEYGLLSEIGLYTAVIEAANLPALLARGWHCEPLGLPRRYGDQTLLAVRVEIGVHTIELLRRAGNYAENALQLTVDATLIAA